MNFTDAGVWQGRSNANQQLRAADEGALVVVDEALGERREIPLAK
jgi:hypothetical protein